MKCYICDTEGFVTKLQLLRHLKKHHPTFYVDSGRKYYDLFFKKFSKSGFCVICNKPTRYISFSKGYRKTCSVKCVMLSKFRKRITRKEIITEYEYKCISKSLGVD